MTNRAHDRRDPQKGKKGFSTNKGFTLIELMIAIGVMAVIMSLAFPSYRMLIEKRQVSSSAAQIAAFLSSAKMEAIKRNQNVRLAKTETDSGWCIGFASYAANVSSGDADAACDCTISTAGASGSCSVQSLDGSAPELKVLNLENVTRKTKLAGLRIGVSEGDVVSFDPLRGMLSVDDAVVASPLEVQLTSKQDKYALNVRMSATGRVTMCSDLARADYSVPGFDDC